MENNVKKWKIYILIWTVPKTPDWFCFLFPQYLVTVCWLSSCLLQLPLYYIGPYVPCLTQFELNIDLICPPSPLIWSYLHCTYPPLRKFLSFHMFKSNCAHLDNLYAVLRQTYQRFMPRRTISLHTGLETMAYFHMASRVYTRLDKSFHFHLRCLWMFCDTI